MYHSTSYVRHPIGIVINNKNIHNVKHGMLICELDSEAKMLHVFQFPFAATPLFIDVNLADMANVKFHLQNLGDSQIEVGRVVIHFHGRRENYAHNGANLIANVIELSFAPEKGASQTPSSTELWEDAKILLEDLKDILSAQSSSRPNISAKSTRTSKKQVVEDTQEYTGSTHSSQRTSKSREVLPVGGSSPSRPVGQQPAVVTLNNNSKGTKGATKEPEQSKAVTQTKANGGAASASSSTKKQATEQKASTTNPQSVTSEAAFSRSTKAKASSASSIPPPTKKTPASTKPASKIMEQDDESTQEEMTEAPLPPAEPAAPRKKRDQLRDADGELAQVTTPAATSATTQSKKVKSTKGDNVSPPKRKPVQYSRSPTKLVVPKPKQNTKAKQPAKTQAVVGNDDDEDVSEPDGDNPSTSKAAKATKQPVNKKTTARAAATNKNSGKLSSTLAKTESRQKAAPNEDVEDEVEPTVTRDVFDVPVDDEEEEEESKPKTGNKRTSKTTAKKGKAASTAKAVKTGSKSSKKASVPKKGQVVEQPRRKFSRLSGSTRKRYNDDITGEQEDEGANDSSDDHATDDEQDLPPPSSEGRAVAAPREDTRQSLTKKARDEEADEPTHDAAYDKSDDNGVPTGRGPSRQKILGNGKPPQQSAPAPKLAHRTAHTPRPEPRSAVARMTETDADLLPADSTKPQLVTFTASGPANQGIRSVSREQPRKMSTREQNAIHGEADEDLDVDGFRSLADEVIDHVAPVLEHDDHSAGIDVTVRNIEQNTRLSDVPTHAKMNDVKLLAAHGEETAPDMFTETQVPGSPEQEESPSRVATQSETAQAQESMATDKIEDSIGNMMPYLSIPQELAAPASRHGDINDNSSASTKSKEPSHYWKTESAQNFIHMNLPADIVSTVTEHMTAGLSAGVVNKETLDEIEGHSLVMNNTAPAGTIDPRMLSQHTVQSLPPATENLHLAVRTETEVSPGHIRVTEHELEIQREVKRPASDTLQAEHIKRTRVVEVQDNDEDESSDNSNAHQLRAQDEMDNERHEIEQVPRQKVQPAAQHGSQYGIQYEAQHETEHEDSLSLLVEPNQENQSSPLSEAQPSSQELDEERVEEDIDELDESEVQYVSPILSQSKTVTANGRILPRDDRVIRKPSLQPPPSRQAGFGPGKSSLKDDSQKGVHMEKKSVRIDVFDGAPVSQRVQQGAQTAPQSRNTTTSAPIVAQQQFARTRAPVESSVRAKDFPPPIESGQRTVAHPIPRAKFGASAHEEPRPQQKLDHRQPAVVSQRVPRLPQPALQLKKQSAVLQSVGRQQPAQCGAKHQAPVHENVQNLLNPVQPAVRPQPIMLTATTATRPEPGVVPKAPAFVKHPMLPPIMPREADDVFRPQEVKPLSKFQQSLQQSILPPVEPSLPAIRSTGIINWDDSKDADKGQSTRTSSDPRSIDKPSAEQVCSSSDPASAEFINPNDATLDEEDDNNDEDMEYSSDSSDDDDSDNDSTTLIEDTLSPPTIPAHELSLLNSLTAITQTYTAHIFTQEKRTIDLLIAYERGGLDLVIQFGDCRQEEVAVAEEEIKQVKKETSEALGRILQDLVAEQGEVKGLKEEVKAMEKRMQEGMKRESEALKELFALC